ncbi:MAG: TerC family protein [Bacteroidota bacterium]
MLVWIVFIALIFVFLALDLGIFNRNPHVISTKEALRWTALWVSLSLVFSGVIFILYKKGITDNFLNLTPTQAVVKYITGYLIELSLSIDNVFVIALIFASFSIPAKYQHRVLFWGILGAIIFRGLMLFFGIALIRKLSWSIYIFGGFLIYTALKMLFSGEQEVKTEDSKLIRLVKRFFPVTSEIESSAFFIKKQHILYATPLFLAMLVIESADVIFALDSIPAILAITTDPFIVFSSNIFAILGLRSLYFALAGMIRKFYYIKYSLIVILAFVGVKMIISHHVELPEWLSLSVVAVALAAGILYSRYKSGSDQEPAHRE